MAVSYHDTVTKLQAPRDAPAGPFAQPAWFALLERHGAAPRVIVGDRGADCAALVMQESGAGHWRAMRHLFAFSWAPLALSGSPDEHLFAEIARDLKGRAWRVDLDFLAEEDASTEALAAGFRRSGWIVHRAQCDTNHIVELRRRSFAEYWADRPGRLRSTFKRKAGRVAVELIDRFDPDVWSAYQKVHANSWKPDEKDIGLLEDFARLEGATGRLRMGLACHDGEPVAAQLWTVEDGTAYIHKLSYDEKFAPLSPGTTLSAAMFARAIDGDRVARIDFGTGGDGYKRDWMEAERRRIALTCLDPLRARSIGFLIAKGMARLARLPGRS